jgi:hypothetical protein
MIKVYAYIIQKKDIMRTAATRGKRTKRLGLISREFVSANKRSYREDIIQELKRNNVKIFKSNITV